MKKIGVIGCGGMIGPIICNYLLHEDVEIIGGQRSKPDFSKYPENFKWKRLDINNDINARNNVMLPLSFPQYFIQEVHLLLFSS